MGYWGSCSWHGDWENVTNWCPACWASNETKPDRSARIRALAERMVFYADGHPEAYGDPPEAQWCWDRATELIDELDRLEAAEREKERK